MKKSLVIFMASIFLLSPLAAASLTLLSPNGGEKWIRDEIKAITWKAENWTGYVNITLRKTQGGQPYVKPIAHHVPAEIGKYMWQVGKFCDGTWLLLSDLDLHVIGACTCFQITISVDGPLPDLSDHSDSNFYICRFIPHLIRVPIAKKN
jgi:hypothetical protein